MTIKIKTKIYCIQRKTLKKENRRLTYINLLTNGMLSEYLFEIDKQAREHFGRIVKQ